MDGWIDGWIDRERHGQAVDGPYGSSRGTHNYPSPDAARSHAHSAADLCPTIYFMPPRPPRLAAGPCNSCGGRERGGGAGAPSKVGHALVSRQAPARASLSGGGGTSSGRHAQTYASLGSLVSLACGAHMVSHWSSWSVAWVASFSSPVTLSSPWFVVRNRPYHPALRQRQHSARATGRA